MLFSLEHLPDTQIQIGEMLVSVSVSAANVVKDIRENIKNLVGGRLVHYEALIEATVARGLRQMEEKAKVKGYDGVVGLKIAHPNVVNGGVEIVVYGNGFRYVDTAPDQNPD